MIVLLSIYFISVVWVFVLRYGLLKHRLNIETDSLTRIYMGFAHSVSAQSVLSTYTNRAGTINSEILKAAMGDTVRVSTKGLTLLSIVAATSPFIGLFGTVIGILETFSHLANQKSAGLSVVAPAISEALIATAVGIFVATFAYSFHLILKRKAYELSSVLGSEIDVILSKHNGGDI